MLDTTETTTGRLYPVPAACGELGVKPTTLYGLLGTGKLQAVKLGRRTLVTEASINAFKASLPRATITTGRTKAAA